MIKDKTVCDEVSRILVIFFASTTGGSLENEGNIYFSSGRCVLVAHLPDN